MNRDKRLESLWNYCVSLYEKEGVKETCLSLQDRFGADVILILFLCWIWSKRGVALNKKEIDLLVDCSGPWQKDVVSAIRKTRKQVGQSEDKSGRTIYRSLRASEMDAERQELIILDQALGELSEGHVQQQEANDLSASFFRYFEIIGAEMGSNDRQMLLALAKLVD